jgi:hypothetical protein
MPALGYLYANHADSGFWRISDDPQNPPLQDDGIFKFTKGSDGSFAIYSVSMVNHKDGNVNEMICTKHKVNNNANSGRTLPE